MSFLFIHYLQSLTSMESPWCQNQVTCISPVWWRRVTRFLTDLSCGVVRGGCDLWPVPVSSLLEFGDLSQSLVSSLLLTWRLRVNIWIVVNDQSIGRIPVLHFTCFTSRQTRSGCLHGKEETTGRTWTNSRAGSDSPAQASEVVDRSQLTHGP